MSSLRGIKPVLGIVHVVLSIITICHCIAAWRRAEAMDIIGAESVE